MSVFEIPTTADDEGTISYAARRLSDVGHELDGHHARLISAGALATGQWVGASSSQFATIHEAGLAQLKRLADAHHAHAAIHSQYASQVTDTKNTSAQSHSALQGHLDTYSGAVVTQLRALHGEADAKFNAAKAHLHKAGSDFLGGDIVGSIEQLGDAATSAFQGVADSAVEELLSHLSSWQPQYPAPQLTAMRPGADKLVDQTENVISNELSAMGDFLASQALEVFSDVLAAMGLSDAARAVNASETEFIASAVATQQQAGTAFNQLAQTGTQLAEQLKNTVDHDIAVVWHATQHFVAAVGHDLDEVGDAVGGWIKHNAAFLKDISHVLGALATVAAFAAMIPGIDVIALPLAAALTAAQMLDDSAVALATGKGWSDVAMDAVGLVTMGMGTAAVDSVGDVARAGDLADGIETASSRADELTGEAGDLSRSAEKSEARAEELEANPEGHTFQVGEDGSVKDVNNSDLAQQLHQDASDARTGAEGKLDQAASKLQDVADDQKEVASLPGKDGGASWGQWTKTDISKHVHPFRTFGEIKGTGLQKIGSAWADETRGITKIPYVLNQGASGVENVINAHDAYNNFVNHGDNQWGSGLMHDALGTSE